MGENGLFSCAIVVAYLGLNSLLNLLNRWALGLYGLRFPLVMTASHMIFGTCALAPMMCSSAEYVAAHAPVLRRDWRGLLTIAVMNGFQIACNNASLTVMELSMNQVIRASIPVLVALLGVCIEGKTPTYGEGACLVVISFGVVLCVWEESRNAMLGIVLTTTSSVMQSIQMSLSGRLMAGKLDSFQMTFYTGPVAFATLAPFALGMEYSVVAQTIVERPGAMFAFLGTSCCVAVVYNVVLFQSVRTLSSVGTAILGNVKIVLLLFLSSLMLGELGRWTANQLGGCVLTFGAAAAYSYLRSKPRPPPLRKSEDSGSDSASERGARTA